MTELADIFSLSPAFSIVTVAGAGIIGFIIGYVFKSTVIAKHKKRILNLEDEMLSNHARILDLEKQISELKHENSKHSNKDNTSSSKLKAS